MAVQIASVFPSLVIVFWLAVSSSRVAGEERAYYVGIIEVDWEYSPNMRNEITGQNITASSPEAQYVIQGPERIGSVYKKAVYREYTDDSFTTQVERPSWLGFLGPMIYGEVGDTILIHTKNMASREYSVHPHGVFYLKDSEGAVYEDNTKGKDKDGERIPPGGSFTYRWEATERAGPADGGPNCVPWIYHSHIESTFGTNSGVVGFMLICRAGILDENNQRTDVDKDFVLMFTVTDENLSYYLDENIARFTTSTSLDPGDEDFIASNKMDSVNGYLFGSLPGLDMCLGDRVAWHIMGIGSEIDVHTVNFHGNVLELRNHRVDTVSLTPAVVASAEMHAINPGTWLAKSHVVTHKMAGAEVLYRVNPDCGPGVEDEPLAGQMREYFIAAVEEDWNYGPTGLNNLDGTSLTNPDGASHMYFTDTDTKIPGTYTKARYVEYTDAQFNQAIVRTSEEEHLGILGPVIRAEVGDWIRVTFKNMASRPYSMHPRGVMYDKANEGMTYQDGTDSDVQGDGSVGPGETYIYNWTVPMTVGPKQQDQDCITWLYSSAADEVRDVYSGLVGPLLICKAGALDQSGKQIDVDHEFILLFMIFDENLSWYIDDNIQRFAPNADPEDGGFVHSNTMTSINGFAYANLPGLLMTTGQQVSWHVADLGKDFDQHTAYFHQLSFLLEGRRVDSVPLFPGITQTFMSKPDNPGTWMIECETNMHFTDGMTALYTVASGVSAGGSHEEAGDNGPSGQVRTYFIAALEMEWDYTPDLYDPVRSQALTDEDSPGYMYVTRGDTSIGSRYRKAIFREFDDGTFVRQVRRRSVEDMSLGILGPVIRAEVGDTIRVIFKNLATQPYSIHPQNLLYNKTNEGAVYGNQSTSDTAVMPQEIRTYTWLVPDNRGPSATEHNCISSVYYSSINRVEDTNSGLVGPLVICRPGTLGDDGRRTDVDKEFNIFFTVMDENQSWYLQQNIQHYCLTPDAVDKSDPDFEGSNRMHGINGLLFNNLHHLEMTVGELVAWNLIGLGDVVDLHSVHFHGHTVVYKTDLANRLDVSELFPGTFLTVEMLTDDPGIWLVHCHVNHHMMGGMETFYTVHAAGETTPLLATTPSGSTLNMGNAISVIVLALLTVCGWLL